MQGILYFRMFPVDRTRFKFMVGILKHSLFSYLRLFISGFIHLVSSMVLFTVYVS